MVRIGADEAITLNYWHKVRIVRLDGYATMQIDDGVAYSGQAKVHLRIINQGTHRSMISLDSPLTLFLFEQGNLTELNLEEPLFIGGMDDFGQSNEEANLTHCLNGAIQRLIVNGDHHIGSNLLKSSERASISSYLGPPCDLNKCEGNGQCVPLLNNYECKIF